MAASTRSPIFGAWADVEWMADRNVRPTNGGQECPPSTTMDSFDNWIHGWLMLGGWATEAVFKLILAAVLGGLVGFERELRGREAGFRTNILVGLGCALLM